MTLIEAINAVDELKPNSYSREEKIRWISCLDGMVKTQIVDTHITDKLVSYGGYDGNTAGDTELLIPAPYDELYIWWMSAQIDFYNGEFLRYNNSVTLFNESFRVYGELFHRTHTPAGAKHSFF